MRNSETDQKRLEKSGIADPNSEQRDYVKSGDSPLVALLDNPWYSPHVPDAEHYHNYMEIGMCVTGSGIVSLKDQQYRFSSGDVLVVPKHLRHSQQNEGNTVVRWLYLVVDEACLLSETPRRHQEMLRAQFAQIRDTGKFLMASEENRIIRTIFEEIFALYQETKPVITLEQESLLNILICRIFKEQDLLTNGNSHSEILRAPIEPALRYVSENYADNIDVAGMAASCAMSLSYFRKVFEQVMQMRPLEYLNRYRINRSMYLLRMTNKTVISIANQVGFDSIATYNRNFVKYVGRTPGEWRKNTLSSNKQSRYNRWGE